MKFGRQLLQEAYPQYRHFYLAYKDLKQAIKLITGADASEYSIKEVTSNFGNVPALAGSVFRPPESRFQELLNGEKEKINKFLEVTLTAVNGALKELMKDLLRSPEQYPTHVEQAVDEQSEQLVFLQNYQRINHIGLRKITKKYDKHNRSNSSPWYMAQLAKEPFLNADFETPLKYLSLCYSRLRTIRISSSGEISKYDLDQTKNDEEYDDHASDDHASDDHASSLTGSFDETDQLHTRKDQETPLFEMQSNEEFFNRTPEDVPDSELPVAHSTTLMSSGSPEKPVDLSETSEAVKQSKYLVRSDEIMRLKVLVVKFMALASIGSQRFSGRAAVNDLLHPLNVVKKPNMETSAIASPGTKISHCCVYFDTQQFDNYRDVVIPGRISRPDVTQFMKSTRRKQEQWIYRLRWIGINSGEPEKVVFLEKVTLMEPASSPNEWLDILPDNHTGSVRDTVVLKQKHLPAIFQGDFDASAWCKRKRLNRERTVELTNLIQGAMDKFKDGSLVPVLQVWHYRTAFKVDVPGSLENRHVRVYLDEHVQFLSEVSRERGNITFKVGNWDKRGLTTYTAARSQDSLDSLPFAVLSIAYPKGASLHRYPNAEMVNDPGNSGPMVTGDFSDFVQTITGLTSVKEIWAFNYFVHGLMNVSSRLRLNLQAPHWLNFIAELDNNSVDNANNSDKAIDQDHKNKEVLLSKGRVDILRASPGDKLKREHEDDVLRNAASVTSEISFQRPFTSEPSETLLPPPKFLDGVRSVGSQGGFLALHAAIPIDEAAMGKLNDGGNELRRPLLRNNRPQTATWTHKLAQWVLQRRTAREIVKTPEKVSNTSVRVEPKTFFANERTLLQWMNTAVLLATIAITLLNFGSRNARVAGFIMAPTAIFFIIHSYRMYAKRSRALERKEPIDYTDRSGPFLLVVCLVFSLSLVVLLNVFKSSGATARFPEPRSPF